MGNCFKTKEEAVTALNNITALLLSLHDDPAIECNQLPKLTAEVFDRPDCPEWAKYAAVDSNGAGYYYSEKPFILSDSFGWGMVCSENNRSEFISYEFNNSDWQNSLIERPAKLPDWCKFGVVGWHKRAGYFEVCADDELAQRISIKQIDDKSRGWLSYETLCTEVKQARLRPYNAEEMRSLVGKVIENHNYTHFINAFDIDLQEVVSGSDGYTAKELVEFGYTIDGAPCGVLEHFENGEWVE